jgi:aquaporin Z
MNLAAIAVEFVGTFLFFLTIVATGNAFAICLALLFAIMMFGKVSGGHFNPGVTLMMLYKGDVLMDNALFYLVVQVAAGILAVETWRFLVSSKILPNGN